MQIVQRALNQVTYAAERLFPLTHKRGEPKKDSEIAIYVGGGGKRIMTTRRALYYRIRTYQQSVVFIRRKDVWTCKHLAAEVKHLEIDGQVLRKGSRVQLEIGASGVDTQKCTLERVTRCAA